MPRVSTQKFLPYFIVEENVVWLETYEGIVFEVSDVIGESYDYWGFDSNGKPILKEIEQHI